MTPLLGKLAQTLNFEVGQIATVPILSHFEEYVVTSREIVSECIELSKSDWDSFETSWGFGNLPFTKHELLASTVETSFSNWYTQCYDNIHRMQGLEEKSNRLFIHAYGLQDELTPNVSEEHITLARPDRGEDIKWLISYAIGCMMGRYSLDKPGLVYAYSGNRGFDPSQYETFPADQDGIVPITDFGWFPDDATNRVVEFIRVTWPQESIEKHLKFIAESLGVQKGEHLQDTIRRYLAQEFFKDHLRWYKKRPIYWLFTSGKHRAFQCLVYLHRYNESTLSRMRTEYVIPLQGKIASRIDQLDDDIAAASSTSHRKKLEKERDMLVKQQMELQMFDEKLRHYADRRISLDLDDGVKVNYGKFGDLLGRGKNGDGAERRMMDTQQLNEAFYRLFIDAGERIVFWHDPEHEFIDFINRLPFLTFDNTSVSVIRLDQVSTLAVKIRLAHADPDSLFLLYAPTEEPDYEDDWLLDIRLYSHSFRADRASIILNELGLEHHHLREHIAARRRFFDSRERLQKLQALVTAAGYR